MHLRRKESQTSSVDFASTLKRRLSQEGIELTVIAKGVDLPKGHLAVVLTLASHGALSGQKLRAERIVNEECIKYLQE